MKQIEYIIDMVHEMYEEADCQTDELRMSIQRTEEKLVGLRVELAWNEGMKSALIPLIGEDGWL